MRVGIINVTGYAGAELVRLLYLHPEAQVTSVTGRSAAGKRLPEIFPHLWQLDLPIEVELDDVEFAFSALPHAASAPAVATLVEGGLPVVDISADFRLRDAADYEAWYNVAHPAPHLLGEAAYGLTELNRDAVRRARLVANPGCYPTGALLALAPAVKAGIIGLDIVVDAKSGVSGAGRSLGLAYHYPEANESVAAYGLDGHRHLPEMTQELKALCNGVTPRLTFIPHLIPMTRGILTTCYADLLPGRLAVGDGAGGEVQELYREFYRQEPFVRVAAEPPQTKHTWGNNLCLVYPTVDTRAGRLVVVSCLDNLVKGAAGQAVQNMNAMLGLPEAMGLDQPAVYP
ncbi:MAG: N-acetyl-gamma-glutamyl-phosphate reductase [Dehalococcoidia bacterium]